jgi:hypothetical protein
MTPSGIESATFRAKCNIVEQNACTLSQSKLEQPRKFSDKSMTLWWTSRIMNNLDISEVQKTVRI